MSSLLDQAIKIGQEMEKSDSRIQQKQQTLEQLTAAEQALRQRLAQIEREHQQRLQSEQAAWENTRRQQESAYAQRLADVISREEALKALPAQLEQLAKDQQAVAQRKQEAQTQWQKAKEAELDWIERDKELDAKAEAINQLAAKQGVVS